jgi:hypothetical protein
VVDSFYRVARIWRDIFSGFVISIVIEAASLLRERGSESPHMISEAIHPRFLKLIFVPVHMPLLCDEISDRSLKTGEVVTAIFEESVSLSAELLSGLIGFDGQLFQFLW